MASYRTTAKSPMTPEQTFEYLADFSTAAEWDANTKSSDLVSGEATSEGAEYRVVTEFAGRDLTLTYRTTELQRPGKIVFQSGTAVADIEDVITITPDGSGSKVSYEANIKPRSKLPKQNFQFRKARMKSTWLSMLAEPSWGTGIT